MMGFFHSREGKLSMARLLSFMAVCAGIALAAFGAITKDSQSVLIGAGLIGSGEALKFGHKTQEK